MTKIIHQVFELFPNCSPLLDSNISQVGNYITFEGYKRLDKHHSMFDFRIYIASYSFSNDNDSALEICNDFVKIIDDFRVNATYCKSLMNISSIRLIGSKGGLFIYCIDFNLKAEV